jgi:hypothetical protein
MTCEGVEMSEPERALRAVGSGLTDREYVEFWPAGTLATGRFHCTACGNAVTVKYVLPRCQLCGERLWERDASSPYAGVT